MATGYHTLYVAARHIGDWPHYYAVVNVVIGRGMASVYTSHAGRHRLGPRCPVVVERRLSHHCRDGV